MADWDWNDLALARKLSDPSSIPGKALSGLFGGGGAALPVSFGFTVGDTILNVTQVVTTEEITDSADVELSFSWVVPLPSAEYTLRIALGEAFVSINTATLDAVTTLAGHNLLVEDGSIFGEGGYFKVSAASGTTLPAGTVFTLQTSVTTV